MNKIILYVITFFMILGGVDYALGSKYKIGAKFEDGIKAMGALGIGMIGIYSLAPVCTRLLAPAFKYMGMIFKIDPSVFASLLLATDMGGYQMANALTANRQMALFSGIILASSFGATISFTIPLAIGIIEKEDQKYFSQGVMAGLISIPVGAFAAGLWQKIGMLTLLKNIAPILIFAVLLAIGLIKIPEKLMKGFNAVGRIIVILSIIGLLLQGLNSILGIKLIKDIAPFDETMTVVGKISFVLAGAFPMVAVINSIFKNSFRKIGRKIGINSISVVTLLGNLASNILIFSNYKLLNPKGKVICTAFGVSAAFVFGGQLGFVSAVEPEMISPFIISKLVSGLVSIFFADWIFEKNAKEDESIICMEV